MLFRLIAPFAFAYFLSYLYRVVNAVAGPALTSELGLGAAELGLLTSTYFLAFAAFQLPLGVLLDRYGPRRVEAVLLLSAAAGAAAFALGSSLTALAVGRALIGLGVSAGLMAAFKAYSAAVPADRLPHVNGIHLAVGGLGALAGGAPSAYFLDLFGWRSLFWGLFVLSLLSSLVLALFGPRREPHRHTESLMSQFRAFRAIVLAPVFRRAAPLCIASQMTALAVTSLWAGPWLRTVLGLPADAAANVLSLMALAMVASFLAFGWIASRLERRGIPTLWVSVTGMIGFMTVQLALILYPAGGSLLWLAYAFFGTAGVLAYPAITGTFPQGIGGRVNTALNFLVFTAAFAVQWGVGIAVDALSPSYGTDAAYGIAFTGLLAIQLAAALWLFARPAAALRN